MQKRRGTNGTRRRLVKGGTDWNVQREWLRLTAAQPHATEQTSCLADVLPAIMKQFGLEQRLWERELLSEWPALAGANVARHCRPGRLDRKTLEVYVRHPIVLSELERFGKAQLLANLQGRFGADRIRRLRLRLDSDPPASS